MSQQQARKQQTHSDEVRQVYARVLAGSSVGSRYVEVDDGGRVHLLETGAGPPLVLLPGGGGSAGFFLPLLNELHGVRALAPDRPGQGLSDPIDLPRSRYRETAIAWVDRLLDALELDAVALLGHSGGAMWALWYALAHPERVKRLVLIGPPAVPKTRCPLLIRLAATPGVGELLSRLVPPSPKSVLQFAHHAAREKATLARYPDLVDLFVATFRDPIADQVARAEERVFISPFALVLLPGSAVVPGCDPTSYAGWPCPRFDMGRAGTARQRFGRPSSDGADPARAPGGAGRRARAMARAACAGRRGGGGFCAVTPGGPRRLRCKNPPERGTPLSWDSERRRGQNALVCALASSAHRKFRK